MYNLILHWNNTGWEMALNSDLSITQNDLRGVAAITPTDVWVAGNYIQDTTTRSQLMHWNDTVWTHTMLPDMEGGSQLNDIVAINSNDIWAVGGQGNRQSRFTYAIHYDGSDWTQISAPAIGIFSNIFHSADALSSNDVWAVGHYGASPIDFHAMAQHWNGISWTNFSLPASITSLTGSLHHVKMISSDNVWAIGSTNTDVTFMIHWNGISWSEVSAVNGAGGAIVARGTEVFAIGERISQWNGSYWTVIDSLTQLTNPYLVAGVTFTNGDIWTAGFTNDSMFHTLIYRSIPIPLPVRIVDYSIRKVGTTASIQWSTSSEINASEFDVERSSDGVDFHSVQRVTAQGYASRYAIIDASPLAGWNYYRLKSTDLDGSVAIFPIRSLNFSQSGVMSFSVYPNPVMNDEVHISLNAEGDYHLSLYDSRGQQMISKKVTNAGASAVVDLPSNLTSGAYLLMVTQGKNVWTEKVFIQ